MYPYKINNCKKCGGKSNTQFNLTLKETFRTGCKKMRRLGTSQYRKKSVDILNKRNDESTEEI